MLGNLRRGEYNTSRYKAKNGETFTASYNKRTYIETESIINICRTVYIIWVLAAAAIYFNTDAEELVLDPLMRMIEKVKLIAKNPLIASSEEIDNAGMMTFIKAQNNKSLRKQIRQGKREKEEEYETVYLEKAIIKIGHLLALGFGEAGAGIIGQNMTLGGELNAVMPGERRYIIIGFCVFDDFIKTTEVLQTDIMTYVNEMAEIVHSIIDRYGGSVNKNLGEAFLLIWKWPQPKQIEEMDLNDQTFDNKIISKPNQIAVDLSVLSFLKILAKINKYKHILKYSKNKEMKRKLGENYRVTMRFGLH